MNITYKKEKAMKQHINYEGKEVFIGLDVHRTFFVASAVSEGQLVKQCRLKPHSEAVVNFIKSYFSGATVKTCYEAGFSGFWLHRELEAAGISNIVVHAAHIEVEANRVKTDKRDSRKLAEQLYSKRLRGIQIPEVAREDLRLLTRSREQLMGKKRRVQIQIRMRLHQFGLIPTELRGRLQPSDVTQVLEDLKEPSSKLVSLKLTLELMLSEWMYYVGKIKELDKKLVQEAKADPLEALYRSVPGIGILTARILSYELGDMSQFLNERALFSFTGLTPGEYSSGEKVCRGHISRQGSSRLRHVLVEAAWKAIKKDEGLREFYTRLATRRGKKRAIVAVARKLIGKIRSVLRNGNNYELSYLKVA
jgi:transposase